MRRRLVVPVLAAAVLTGGLADAAAAATAKRRVPVPRPAAGQIALAAATITARVPRGAKAPRLRLRFPGAASLPPSVRILWATRRARRGRTTTFHVLLMSIHVAGPTARAAQTSGESGLVADAIVAYVTGGYPRLVLKYGYLQVANASGAPASAQSRLYETFQGLKDSEGESVFGSGRLTDPDLDTGHYDDGHAFGWRREGQTTAWARLTEFTNGQLDKVVEEIEAALAVDVDGDGDKGGAGATIDTTVGPPIITGGNPY